MKQIKISFFLIIIILFGCNTTQNIKGEVSDIVTKVYTTLCFHSGRNYQESQQRTYTMTLPKGFVIDNSRGAWHYQRDLYEYKNAIKLYIINNSWYTPKINYDNKIYCNVDTRKNFITDTLYMDGIQKNGDYWKEYIYDDVVIGYINVPKQHKEKFDKAIESLTLVKTKKCK